VSDLQRMLELSNQGLACAQIMMQLALDADGQENADLIRSLGALNNGVGNCGLVCGSLTGAACVISFFAGQGAAEEMADPASDAMIQELFAWFKNTVGETYGGITCPEILQGKEANKLDRCPKIVAASMDKTIDILQEQQLL